MQPFTEFDYQEFKSKKIEAMPDCQLHPLQRAYMAMRRSAAPRLNMLRGQLSLCCPKTSDFMHAPSHAGKA